MKALLAILLALPAMLHAAEPTTAPVTDTFNYILGTQTVGPSYHFTGQTPLVAFPPALQAAKDADHDRNLGLALIEVAQKDSGGGKGRLLAGQALASTSGPMPATSPIVISKIGLSCMTS